MSRPCFSELVERMTAEPRSPATVPPLQCPRCRATLPPVSLGSQLIRCGGCGAAMEVRVRTTPQASEPSAPAGGLETARPRRKPMVEVSGPRRAQAQPMPTLTVDIPLAPEPEQAPSPPPPPVTPTSLDVPWYAEDIERLPEANVDLGQLALESLETLPPLPLRLDVPQASRTGTASPPPPGVPASRFPRK